jgi:hypothetical protein
MKNIKKFEHFNLPEETEVYSDDKPETHSGEYDVNNPTGEFTEYEQETQENPYNLSEEPDFMKQNESKRLKSFNEHQTTSNYMFFANLQTMQRYIDAIMNLSQEEVDEILKEHDWASDHISVACENLEHVHNFLTNHGVPSHDHEDDEEDNEFDAEYEEEFDEYETGELPEEEYEEEEVDDDDSNWEDEEVGDDDDDENQPSM